MYRDTTQAVSGELWILCKALTRTEMYRPVILWWLVILTPPSGHDSGTVKTM